VKKLILFFIILSILFLTLLPSGFIYAQEGITLRIKEVVCNNFPEVDIYFSVFDKFGLPMEDLKLDDFELREKGEVVSNYDLESIVNTENPSYVALLLDTSGSMRGDPLEEAKNAATEFVRSLKDIDEIKVFVFNDDVKFIQDFTTDKNSVINAINSVETEGTKTVLNLAVFEAAKDLDGKPLGNRAIVLLTDGKDEGASIAIEDAIGKAVESRIPIYSVGFGKNFNEGNKDYDEGANEALSRFSILTSGKFFIAQEEEDLAPSFDKISDLLKYQYHIKYTSSLLKDGSDNEINLSITSFDEVLKDNFTITTPTFELRVDIDQVPDEFEVVEPVTITPSITIDPGRFSADEEVDNVQYYLDNDNAASLIEEIYTTPYALNFDPEGLDYGKHSIIIKVIDSIGRVYQAEKTVIIPTPPDYTRLYYERKTIHIQKGQICRRKKSVGDEDIGEYEETEGGEIMLDDSEKTWAEGKESLRGEEGEISGSETIIKMPDDFMPNAWLTVIKGSHEGDDYSIPPEDDPSKRKVTIGRSTYNDVVIDDESASRDHAYITIEKDKYTIGDMGSTNGTYLNEKRVSIPRILKDGDKIVIGDTELIFKSLSLKKEKKPKVKNKTKKRKKKS